MSDKIRLFIAVRFSREVDEALARLSAGLRREIGERAPIKWVEPTNIHLTLQFLGDVEEGLVPKLAGSLTGAYDDLAPFEVVLSGVGAFPRPNRAKVIWVGMRHGADGLRALHAATLGVTAGFGVEPDDRPFKAHTTLGRVRVNRGRGSSRPPDLSAALEPLAEQRIGTCQIDAVHLVRSELLPAGPKYTTLDTFPVGG